MKDYNEIQFRYYAIGDDHEEILKLQNYQKQYTWWKSLCKHGNIPHKHDIQFSDLLGWHGDLTLTELVDNNQDWKYIIIGENVKRLMNNKIKQGDRASKQNFASKEVFFDHLARISTGKIITHYKDELPIGGREFINIETISFPLTDEDGKCSHFITFVSKS